MTWGDLKARVLSAEIADEQEVVEITLALKRIDVTGLCLLITTKGYVQRWSHVGEEPTIERREETFCTEVVKAKP